MIKETLGRRFAPAYMSILETHGKDNLQNAGLSPVSLFLCVVRLFSGYQPGKRTDE